MAQSKPLTTLQFGSVFVTIEPGPLVVAVDADRPGAVFNEMIRPILPRPTKRESSK